MVEWKETVKERDSPGSRIFQILVPVPDPANFEFESRSQSRILKWVPVPVPDFLDRDWGIPGTLSRIPTPGQDLLTTPVVKG